jgi:hypothetical protein
MLAKIASVEIRNCGLMVLLVCNNWQGDTADAEHWRLPVVALLTDDGF